MLDNQLIRRYVWQPESLGYDVPLSVFDAAADATYFYHTDANKNVTELSDVSGNVVAHYEYSPFGETVKSEGAYAESNPFRFSSEYHDDETGLVYYNYRYYHPTLGRWISRDPIEEKGGYNLYNMVGNSPVDLWDDRGYHWCQERQDINEEIEDLNRKLNNSRNDEDRRRLLDQIEKLERSKKQLDKKIQDGTRAAYGETSNIFPQRENRNKGIYNRENYNEQSAQELENARRDIAEVRSRNSKTAQIDKSSSTNSIEKAIWNDCKSAAEKAGNSLPDDVKHFYIRQDGVGRQKPNWAAGKEPYKSYGPFEKVGRGGDVPQGKKTYIDFYQGVK